MSNSLAIAAVTSALRGRLDDGFQDADTTVSITARPLDRARDNESGAQLNLFLYHLTVDPAWRNMDPPWRVKPGERGFPPLPLNLYYLLTAFSEAEQDGLNGDVSALDDHAILGRAMRILHDEPVLKQNDLQPALSGSVKDIFITPQPLSLEDLSKIWTSAQTRLRLSAAYEVSVVLVESEEPRPAPMPVLRRGPEDRGVATAIGPFPTLEAIRRPSGARFGVQLGDEVELIGHNLGGETVEVRFTHPLRENVRVLSPAAGGSSTKLVVHLPPTVAADPTDPDEVAAAEAAKTNWTAGFYGVDVVMSSAGDAPDRHTNQVPMALSPIVEDIDPNPAARDGDGIVSLTITCAPEVLPDQQARLLLGEREIQSAAHPSSTATLQFEVTDAPVGTHVVRLRIDGVDSLPIIFNKDGEPGFDPTLPEGVPIFDPEQKVIIT